MYRRQNVCTQKCNLPQTVTLKWQRTTFFLQAVSIVGATVAKITVSFSFSLRGANNTKNKENTQVYSIIQSITEIDWRLAFLFPGDCMSGSSKIGIVKAKIKGNRCKRRWFHNSISITLGNQHLFYIFQIPLSRKLLDEFSPFFTVMPSHCV